jgi:predicted RNA-binding protein YlqC (UPF0109 family)
MEDTLRYLLTNIVDNPDAIRIDMQSSERRNVLVVHAHKDDMGKIIGKQGRTIRAIRDIIKIMAARERTYVDVELAEEESNEEV